MKETLETTLQNKTNELNNIINNVQCKLDDVEQKNKVKVIRVFIFR